MSYAPGTETGDWIDVIVNSDRPLRELRQHYEDAVIALSLYGERMQEKYSVGAAKGRCAACATEEGTKLLFYRWRAFIRPRFRFTKLDALLLLLGKLGCTLEHTVLDFETAHVFCPECAGQARLRRRLSVAINGLSFFLLLVGMGLAVVGGGIFFAVHMARDCRDLGVGAIIGVCALVLSIIGLKKERNLPVPTALRHIGRRPFQLASIVQAELP